MLYCRCSNSRWLSPSKNLYFNAVFQGFRNVTISSRIDTSQRYQDRCTSRNTVFSSKILVSRNVTIFYKSRGPFWVSHQMNTGGVYKNRNTSPYFNSDLQQSRSCHTINTRSSSCFSRESSPIMLDRLYNKRQLFVGSTIYRTDICPQSVTSRLEAERLVRGLSEEERKRVQNVLQDLEQELLLEKGHHAVAPNFNQLWILAFVNCIPFIGFGFFDNAIMILAGEYIDHTLGVALGISTMAAAAIGNMISDVAGIGLAGWIEATASRLGLEEPNLTPSQLTMTSSRVACHVGRAIGIVIGCLIGMAPLAFISRDEHYQHENNTENQVPIES